MKASLSNDVNFNGGISTRVVHRTGMDLCDSHSKMVEASSESVGLESIMTVFAIAVFEVGRETP